MCLHQYQSSEVNEYWNNIESGGESESECASNLSYKSDDANISVPNTPQSGKKKKKKKKIKTPKTLEGLPEKSSLPSALGLQASFLNAPELEDSLSNELKQKANLEEKKEIKIPVGAKNHVAIPLPPQDSPKQKLALQRVPVQWETVDRKKKPVTPFLSRQAPNGNPTAPVRSTPWAPCGNNSGQMLGQTAPLRRTPWAAAGRTAVNSNLKVSAQNWTPPTHKTVTAPVVPSRPPPLAKMPEPANLWPTLGGPSGSHGGGGPHKSPNPKVGGSWGKSPSMLGKR